MTPLELSLEYTCRSCGEKKIAPEGTDLVDLYFKGRYCDDCGGNEDED